MVIGGRMVARILGVVLLSGGVAVAQPGERWGQDRGPRFGGEMAREWLEPPVTSDEVKRYGELLGLSPDQLAAANLLLEGTMGPFQERARVMRDTFESVRETFRQTRDPSGFTSMRDEMSAFRKDRAEAEAAFLGDLRQLLTPEQEARWGTLERTRRRERTVRRGLMSGERADLVQILQGDGFTPAAREAVGPILERYEADLDRELIRRNEAYERAMDQGPVFFGGGGDPAAAQKLWEDGREASTRVRDVNRRYAREIEAALPDDQRAAFTKAFKRASFGRVYRETFAERTLDAADKAPGLDDTQRDALRAIRDTHARELAGLNTRLEQAIEASEANATPGRMFRRDESPELQELRQARRELDTRTEQKVRELLREDQRTGLPSRDSDEEDGEGPGGRRAGRERADGAGRSR